MTEPKRPDHDALVREAQSLTVLANLARKEKSQTKRLEYLQTLLTDSLNLLATLRKPNP